jgi:hypothetical protein
MIYHTERLKDVDERLVKIITEASKIIHFDILIVCGYRNNIDQLKAFMAGKSKALPGKSKHNKKPSQAIDVVGSVKGNALWERIDLLANLNEAMQEIARSEKVNLDWSKNWKKFVEFNHWEIS